jgi:hypothetical protein
MLAIMSDTALKAYCYLDPPLVLDASVTPIPAVNAAPLQVIADTGTYGGGVGVKYADSTGGLVGVYTGAPGQEVLLCVVGNGVTTDSGIAKSISGVIPPRARVSLRSMTPEAVTSGRLYCVLVGKA